MKGKHLKFCFWKGEKAYFMKPTFFDMVKYYFGAKEPLIIFFPDEYK